MSLTYGSVCSGIEAATVAWHPLGWRAAWFAEIDPFCSALLNYHYPEVRNHGDFTRIGADAGPIDLLVGGTPCQAFSVAGRRAGLDDPRGNLTLEFLRLAARLRPRWVVWENVPGVLSIDGGRTFGTVLGTLAQLGYCCAWRVLDAQYFGVPQRRRRVFVVGYFGDWRRAAAVLFERHSLSGYPPPRREAREEVAGSLGGGTGERGWCNDLDCSGAFVPVSLNAGEDGTGRGVPILPIPILEPGARRGALDDRDGIGVGEPGDPMYTLGAKHPHAVAFSCKDYGADATEPVVFESRFVRNGRGAPDVIAPPLKAQSGASGRGDGAPLVATWGAVRRLTPRECERLQGFPDDWTLVPNYRRRLRGEEIEEMAAYLGIPLEEARSVGATPDGPRYKAIGNSMAVPVMRWIGERIQAVEDLCH